MLALLFIFFPESSYSQGRSSEGAMSPQQEKPFSKIILGFREYIEVDNPDIEPCHCDTYAKVHHKIDELTEEDFYTIANNRLGSGLFDNFLQIKSVIRKGYNPASGKEELTDIAKQAINALNEVRPPSIPIVRFIQMIQEIGDQTESVRAKFKAGRLKRRVGNKVGDN